MLVTLRVNRFKCTVGFKLQKSRDHSFITREKQNDFNFFFNLTTEQSHNFVPGELVHKPALESVPS